MELHTNSTGLVYLDGGAVPVLLIQLHILRDSDPR